MMTTTTSDDDHQLEMKKTPWQAIEDRINNTRFICSREEARAQLKLLIDLAQSPAQKLQILQSLIDGILLWNYETIWDHVPLNVWKTCVEYFFLMLDILYKYPNIKISPKLAVTYHHHRGADYDGPIYLHGDLFEFVFEGFFFRFFDSLEHINPCEPEKYDKWLREEPTLILVCQNVMEYFEQIKDFRSEAKVALQLLRLLHYRSQQYYYEDQVTRKPQFIQHAQARTSDSRDDNEHKTVDEQHTDPPPFVTPKVVPRRPSYPINSRTLIDKAVNLVFKYGSEKRKPFAMLCHIYHLAIIDRFTDSCAAMTKFLDEVQDAGSINLVYFNRALAQLGLCAFRAGCIAEANTYLSWLYEGGRVDKLLGQTVSYIPYEDRGPKPAGQCSFIPYHMHIDLDLLDAAHLVCAMFPEDPNVAASIYVAKGKVISHEISRLFQSSESETSRGLPEHVCDLVVDATMDLRKGNYQKAFMVIDSLKLPTLLLNRDDVLEMLKTKIKEEALRSQQDLLTSICDLPSLYQLTHNTPVA
ncbi:Eukaryotic translation initiation factor 3 subunit c [Thalictrum thalictroides]|uniref:Eukaryotic translation initiation factor 3 subunit c n=1 Tax=Thalictrum thalictroides TaxID=46969 RepID=A0A7J6VEI9_THATH|nr:Eukaryotic translation initiation factor 3 subunit c [Thalictrum thalictroides]